MSELNINSKEDFEELASKISRAEFMEKYLIDKTGRNEHGVYDNETLVISCPSYIKLESSNECVNCYTCWKNAVKDIYFKDDIENASLNNKEQNDIKEKGVISVKLVQTFLDQFTIQVFMDGVCIHSAHVDNKEFEITKKERNDYVKR